MSQMSDNATAGVGVIGTIASWSLNGVLSVAATICTLIVVGPKAWDQVSAWRVKYWPRFAAIYRKRR